MCIFLFVLVFDKEKIIPIMLGHSQLRWDMLYAYYVGTFPIMLGKYAGRFFIMREDPYFLILMTSSQIMLKNIIHFLRMQ